MKLQHMCTLFLFNIPREKAYLLQCSGDFKSFAHFKFLKHQNPLSKHYYVEPQFMEGMVVEHLQCESREKGESRVGFLGKI